MRYAPIAALAVIAWLVWEFRVHILLPARAQVARACGRLTQARDLYLASVRAPSLLGESLRLNNRYRLSSILSELGQHDDAIEQCRIQLRRRLSPPIEANTRRRLADVLEAAGRATEAAAEREKVQALQPRLGTDAESLLSSAREMSAQHRYPEACALYEKALPVIPAHAAAIKPEIMVRLGLASYNAGRPADATRWAEEALSLKPGLQHRLTAHSIAGLGHKSLGRLDDSEAHRKKAMIIAMGMGNHDKASECLAQLGGVQLSRGKLVEAAQSARKAAEMSITHRRQALVLQAEVLQAWGRFDEACEILEEARKAHGVSVPRFEKIMQMNLLRGLAQFNAEAGRWDEAARFLAKMNGDTEDPRLALWTAALRAWITAEQGNREEAAQCLAGVREQAKEFESDFSMLKTVYSILARADIALGDPATGLSDALKWLNLSPDPVNMPEAHLRIGECRLLLGDRDAAQQSLKAAIAVGIDTYSARQAQETLDQMNRNA